jgi:hypothetical protein
MNLKQAVAFIFSSVLGCSINAAAQTERSAINPLVISESKQPSASDAKSETTKLNEAVGIPGNRRDSNSPSGASNDQWHFQFTPYLWIAGINGRGGIGALSVNINSGITDDNVHLNFGFMGSFEARRNKLVVATDLQYSNLGTENPTPGPPFSTASADFKTFILDPEVGYRLAANPEKGRFVDLLGGVRYWHLRADLNFDAGILSTRSATGSKDWADGVIGLRGRAAISLCRVRPTSVAADQS